MGRAVFVTVAIVLLLSADLFCQDTHTIDEMNQMLDVSQRRGQLEMDGGAPFHLVASFEKFDEEGKSAGKGIIDELWESPHQYRQTLTLPEIKEEKQPDGAKQFFEVLTLPPRKLIEVDNGTQGWRTGRWVFVGLFGSSLNAVLRPLYLRSTIRNRLIYEPVQSARESLDCIGTEPDLPGIADDLHLALTTYCLNQGNHLLRRIILPDGEQILFNNVEQFGKKYIGRSIEVVSEGKVRLKLHVDVLEAAEDFSSLDVPSPADAQLLGFHRADLSPLSGQVMQGQPLRVVKVGGLHGKITVKIHIDTTGSVESVTILDASNQIVKAPVVTAVKNWKFRASYQGNQVVAVDRIFSFGNGLD